ncbi:hypothetical protein HYC85_028765 [Camellia sinensis]|uniref:Uncharacterized protein n=1 Tax=Camellia sinensis TaxID=4442 RepID=A0A7J7G032_CAMSI|nr:hypothetical protein HYC85_028765 [Camellia sinensis]
MMSPRQRQGSGHLKRLETTQTQAQVATLMTMPLDLHPGRGRGQIPGPETTDDDPDCCFSSFFNAQRAWNLLFEMRNLGSEEMKNCPWLERGGWQQKVAPGLNGDSRRLVVTESCPLFG